MLIDTLHILIRNQYKKIGFSINHVQIDGCPLYYVKKIFDKSQRHIVFIHGLGTSSSSWIRIMPFLSTQATITCIDLPGHGFSGLQENKFFYRIDEMVNLLHGFISTTQITPAILIGHSLGGWLALKLTHQYPELVEHLILINNAGIRYNGVEKLEEFFHLKRIKDTHKLIQKMWHKYPWYFKPFILFIHRYLKRQHLDEFISSIKLEDFLVEDLKELDIKVDIIWGENDNLISKDSIEIMKHKIPRANFYFIPDCGHVPQLEQHKSLAQILNQLLK